MQEVNGRLVRVVREVRHPMKNILTECGTILTREKWNVVELEMRHFCISFGLPHYPSLYKDFHLEFSKESSYSLEVLD